MTQAATRVIMARREELRARLRAIEVQLEAIRAARGDANFDDEHDPEGTTLATEWSRAEGQRTDVLRELDALRGAFERVDAGTYGVCLACGTAIPPERLEVVPAAVHCVPCAQSAGR